MSFLRMAIRLFWGTEKRNLYFSPALVRGEVKQFHNGC
ncbi:MAG: hypothetical protein ACJAS1_000840 [Oleiphilaceae bacterium]|jgi:hypothetical protein